VHYLAQSSFLSTPTAAAPPHALAFAFSTLSPTGIPFFASVIHLFGRFRSSHIPHPSVALSVLHYTAFARLVARIRNFVAIGTVLGPHILLP
jgi:hypothetical protein